MVSKYSFLIHLIIRLRVYLMKLDRSLGKAESHFLDLRQEEIEKVSGPQATTGW